MRAIRLAGWFALLVGGMMLIMWAFLIGAGQVSELRTEPVNTLFHLASESATALLLILGGGGLLRGRPSARPLCLIALGMLIYATLTAAGYYAQGSESVITVLFCLMAAGAALAARALVAYPWDHGYHDTNPGRVSGRGGDRPPWMRI